MIERTTVRLPQELLNRARKKAAAEGRTLTSIIEDGLRKELSGKRKQPSRRTYPRVSTATGGPAPGMDLPFRALEELDDLAYVERMKKGFR